MAEVHPGCASHGHAESHEALSEPQRAPRPGGNEGGQPFGEDAAAAAAIATKPLANTQLKAHAILCPGQIRQGALIVTVDTLRWGGAQRTRCHHLGRAHAQRDLGRSVIDRPRLEA